jgi:hypothetical protein
MAIVIDVKLHSGQSRAQLSKLSDSLRDLAAQYRNTSQAQAQFAATSSLAHGNVSRAQRAAGVLPGRRMPAPIAGPYGSLAKAQTGLQAAMASGNPAAMFDAQYAMFRANQRIQRAQKAMAPPDPNKDFFDAMMRTRFVQGAFGKMKAMPLGRDLMQFGGAMFGGIPGLGAAGGAGGGASGILAALGPLMSNPVTIAAVAVAAVAAASVAAGVISAKAISSQMSGYARAGIPGLSRANIIAGMNGLGSGADAARAFQNAIGQGGIGAAYAAQAGINPLGGPFGDMDYAKKFNKYADFVARSKTFEEARRRAEAVGMPDLANNYWLSEKSKDELQRKRERPLDPKAMRDTQEFNKEWNTFLEELEEFKRQIGKGFLPVMTNFLDIGGRVVGVFNDLGITAQLTLGGLTAFVELIRQIRKMLGLSNGDESEAKKAEEVQKKHTKALDDHARAMNQHREVIGGGSKAQGAVPKSIRGNNADGLDYVRTNPL